VSNIIYPAQLKYLEGFRDEKDSLILEMEDYASENNVPILSWQSAELLEQLIRIINPKRVLEIGTAIGYSTIRIARNLPRKSLVHTIEKSKDNIEIANEFISRSGQANKIEILAGDALRIMPRLDKKYDFIFLDADKEDYKRLFDYSVILLKKGSVIFIDNLLWHGYTAAKTVPSSHRISTKHIRDFNKMFMYQRNLKTTVLPVGDGIGLGIKN
jgi:predicted O-methyltransferase YrrM